MRRYETICIIDPDHAEEQQTVVIDRVSDLISQHEGLLVTQDKWGSRKLAYEIKKKTRGYYICLDYCGNGTLVDEIERFFRIDDSVLKYMTILLEKDVDLEEVRQEIAQKEAEAAEAEKEAEAKRAELAAAQEAEAEVQPVVDSPAEAAPETADADEAKAAEPGTVEAEVAEPETDQIDSSKEA